MEEEKIKFDKKLRHIFEYFHENPELSYEECNTTNTIIDLLKEYNINILDMPLNTGVVAEIKGKNNGPVIALRSDIDALPITEKTDLYYKSKNIGKMHACGHDFHMTTMIGAAYLLKKHEKDLEGTVRFLFQPAEESSHGAEEIIRTKALENVEVIFGLHGSPDLDIGVLGTNEGPMTAAVDRFEIEIFGKGSHAAYPHLGIDPIIVASNIVMSLQTIISKKIFSFHKAVLSITHIEGGNTWNVIPDRAYIEGTIRTLNDQDRDIIWKNIKLLSENIAISYGAEANVKLHEGPPATNNDKSWTELAVKVAENTGYKVKIVEPKLIGEDFAYYQRILPGTFVNIGIGKGESLHSPFFKVDESAILGSSCYFKDLAEQALILLNKKIK